MKFCADISNKSMSVKGIYKYTSVKFLETASMFYTDIFED